MSDTIFKIVLSLIPIMCTLITAVFIPWIRTKISTEKLGQYITWASKAVEAAEQLYPDKHIGAIKKEYCVEFLTNLVNKDKVNITAEQMDVLIESAVKELKLKKEIEALKKELAKINEN